MLASTTGLAAEVEDKSQTDVSQQKMESDGSWKRPVSSFRNWIAEGGEFEPEKGTLHSNSDAWVILNRRMGQTVTIFMSRMDVVRHTPMLPLK